MDELHEEDARRAFRPHRRPMRVAIAANAVLFGALVVFPYVRGKLRAAEARERFATFAACFWGGEPRAEPGLELPPTERERYAGNVLRAADGWPERCRESLEAVRPDEPFLLFPAVKQGEQKVREAVDRVAQELEALAAARRAGTGTVPDRPYLAVRRLLAALSVLHEAAGASADMAGEAIAFEGKPALPAPARVPLRAALDAVTSLAARGEGMEAMAVDGRGISRVRVSGGRFDVRRVPRPGLVRGAVTGPDGPWLAWAMDASRCAQDEHGCANRALGLAPLAADATRTPDPRWYAGHPAGRIDRVLQVGRGRVWLVAVREEAPHAELRAFDRSAEPEAAERDEPAPVAALEVRPLDGYGRGDTVLLAGGRVIWSSSDGEGGRVFRAVPLGADAEPEELAAVAGPHPFAFACDADDVGWLVLGTADAVRVVRVDGQSTQRSDTLPLGLRAALSPRDPAADRIHLACDDAHADVLALREDGLLLGTRCDASARCAPAQTLATDVGRVDAVRDRGTTVVAWSPRPAPAEVHVGVLGEHGIGRALVPAACWTSGEGFCGAPRLAAADGRVLLATREGTDLLVVETTDAARTWQPMSGVR